MVNAFEPKYFEVSPETGKKFTDKKWKDRIKPEEYVPPESKKKVKKTP